MFTRFLLLAAAAQVTPPVVTPQVTPSPTPGVTATPPAATVAPPLVTVTLPTPAATPTPRAAPRPTPSASPSPRATPSPTPAPTPGPSPSASATAPLREAPAPLPAGVAAQPTPSVMPAPALPVPEEGGWLWTLPVVAGFVVAFGAIAFLVRRRRRAGLPVPDDTRAIEDSPPPAPVPSVPPAYEGPLADLAFDFRARRAGVNLLTATLDAEIAIVNEGDAPATDVHVDLRLLSARGGQDQELDAILADESTRPIAAPFTLAPGERRVLTALATMPRQAINVVTIGDRPMFVPVAAVAVRYRRGDDTGAIAQAFALGIEREGADKLAPFWLDGPSRMHETVATRPYATMVRR